MSYERENIRKLHAYVPGEQPQTTQVVKLNTNENPYPPAQSVLDAISNVAAESLRRYPPPDAKDFRETAARVHGLTPQNIIATNGGDELLRLAITVFCEPSQTGRGLGETWPTYSLYDVLADIHDTSVFKLPLNDDWSLPGDAAKQFNDAGCRLVIIVNPHAPSGRCESVDTLRQLATDINGVLLVDEAYVDFASTDALSLVQPDSGLDNVLILRTLSKGYSLAGLRFGYGLGSANVIAAMHKARDSYNVDVLAQAAAVAALNNREHAVESARAVITERDRLAGELVRRGYTIAPGQSNFLLATAPLPLNAGDIYRLLKEKGVFVRYFDQDRLRDKLRITIGTPPQNNALLDAMDQIAAAAEDG